MKLPSMIVRARTREIKGGRSQLMQALLVNLSFIGELEVETAALCVVQGYVFLNKTCIKSLVFEQRHDSCMKGLVFYLRHCKRRFYVAPHCKVHALVCATK